MNMDDLTDLLFSLIKSKVNMSEYGIISISLGEIADVWNRKNILHDNAPILVNSGFALPQSMDRGFLEDVASAIKALISKEYIIFEKIGFEGLENSVSNIVKLSHLGTRIYVKLGIAGKAAVKDEEYKSWFDIKDCSIFFGKMTYKPKFSNQKKVIKELVMMHQEKDAKGNITNPGNRIKEENLCNELDIKPDRFVAIKKQLDRDFKAKRFPLILDCNDKGILLIHTKD